MIINSPVGRFPFKATSIKVRGNCIRLDGAMGTWPTSLELRATEIPSIVGGLVPRTRLLALAAILLAATLVLGRRRTRG